MDYELSTTYNESGGCWDVCPSGEIDIFNAGDFKEKLIALVTERSADLKIDCKRLEYLDSTALGALVAVLKTVKTNKKDIYLSNLKPHIYKLFKITNLEKAFIISPSDKSKTTASEESAAGDSR